MFTFINFDSVCFDWPIEMFEKKNLNANFAPKYPKTEGKCFTVVTVAKI